VDFLRRDGFFPPALGNTSELMESDVTCVYPKLDVISTFQFALDLLGGDLATFIRDDNRCIKSDLIDTSSNGTQSHNYALSFRTYFVVSL